VEIEARLLIRVFVLQEGRGMVSLDEIVKLSSFVRSFHCFFFFPNLFLLQGSPFVCFVVVLMCGLFLQTMLETGLEMSSKYKETSRGGLATHTRIAANVTEC
jgi:hypothetical protein